MQKDQLKLFWENVWFHCFVVFFSFGVETGASIIAGICKISFSGIIKDVDDTENMFSSKICNGF